MGQRFDPYDTLGVPRGATEDAIKAAHRNKAKQYHPDLNSSGSNESSFGSRQPMSGSSGRISGLTPTPMGPLSTRCGQLSRTIEAPNWEADIIALVRAYMRKHDFAVQFDGTFVQTDALQMAHAPGDIDRVLGQPELDEEALVDEIVIDARKRATIVIAPGLAIVLGGSINRGLIQVAVRVIKRDDQRQRLVTVMKPLFMPLSTNEQRQAEAQCRRFAADHLRYVDGARDRGPEKIHPPGQKQAAETPDQASLDANLPERGSGGRQNHRGPQVLVAVEGTPHGAGPAVRLRGQAER